MYQKISVVGLGYVGLPTAAVLAGRGLDVIGVDTNADVVRTINRGAVHIAEPELDVLVRAAVNSGRLRAVTEPEPAEVFLIAVPTPLSREHAPDLSYVEAATRAIAPVLEKSNLVVLESTCPVGTTERMAGWLAQTRPDLKFPHQAGEDADVHLAYCPERVLPGRVLRELVENDRVIGGMTSRCAGKAVALYRRFVEGDCLVTDTRTAEMVKLAENAFRDVNIAFANELSLICEKLGIDVWKLIALANRHPRVEILQPGPGVGGHCIPVDPWFIVDSVGEDARLIREAREVNDGKPAYIAEKIKQVGARFRFPKIACLGLSYKADVDDLRESPAVKIVQQLASERVGEILVVEPHLSQLPQTLAGLPNIYLVEVHDALRAADVVVGLVDHRLFKEIDQEMLKDKAVIDTRGMWL